MMRVTYAIKFFTPGSKDAKEKEVKLGVFAAGLVFVGTSVR
jgi:hypothetical protein